MWFYVWKKWRKFGIKLDPFFSSCNGIGMISIQISIEVQNWVTSRLINGEWNKCKDPLCAKRRLVRMIFFADHHPTSFLPNRHLHIHWIESNICQKMKELLFYFFKSISVFLKVLKCQHSISVCFFKKAL